MASSLITTFIYPSLLCVAVPFASSLITNTVALLPSSSPPWLCSGSMFASALVHSCIAVAIVASRMFRFPSSSVLGALGMLLTAAFHAQIASGWRDAVDKTITAQAGLSMVRSVVACFITWLEGSMMDDEAVRSTRVWWAIGNGGYPARLDHQHLDGHDDGGELIEASELLLVLPEKADPSCLDMSTAASSTLDKGSGVDDEEEQMTEPTAPPPVVGSAPLRRLTKERDVFAQFVDADLDEDDEGDKFLRFVEQAAEHRKRTVRAQTQKGDDFFL